MGLPKLNVPMYRHKLTGINKEIKYRTFTVKEQKILLAAKESEDEDEVIDAVKQIISLCTEGTVDPDTLPVFDIEDLFLRIRAKSVSNICEIGFKDKESGKAVIVKINLDDVKVQIPEEHSPKIMLSDNVGIVLKYPTINDRVDITGSNIDNILKTYIDYVFDAEEVYKFAEFSEEEVNDWIESIDTHGIEEVQKFFRTMPALKHSVSVPLQNGEKETIVFEGIQSFFG